MGRVGVEVVPNKIGGFDKKRRGDGCAGLKGNFLLSTLSKLLRKLFLASNFYFT